MSKLLAKVCTKCGRASKARPRERKCKHRAFGKGSYCCWGKLVQLTPKIATGQESVPSDETAAPASPATSGALEASLSKAMQEIDDGLRRIRLTLSAIGRWQKRAKRIQKRITWRDHPELAPAKKERAKKVTRKITLPKAED